MPALWHASTTIILKILECFNMSPFLNLAFFLHSVACWDRFSRLQLWRMRNPSLPSFYSQQAREKSSSGTCTWERFNVDFSKEKPTWTSSSFLFLHFSTYNPEKQNVNCWNGGHGILDMLNLISDSQASQQQTAWCLSQFWPWLDWHFCKEGLRFMLLLN